MEENRRRHSSSPQVSADLAVDENFGPPSPSDSNSNSSLIEDSEKDCLTAWTDEKHDLYLDHLESSFVEQLHRSIGALAWCSEHDSKGSYFPQKPHAKTRNTSQQLKMVQDDCSEKIDLKRSQPLLTRATNSLLILKSRPRCAGKERFTREAKWGDGNVASNLCTDDKLFFNEQISARHGKSVDYAGEFSDQNFEDEASEQMCITTISKRSKTIVSEF